MTAASPHIPVLLKEVLTLLAPKTGDVFIDATFGAGGYSQALLEAEDCQVIAIDRDPDAIKAGQPLVTRYQGRLTLIQGRFGDLVALCRDRQIVKIDGIVMDIGTSSMQLDQATRGFSFKMDGPLDMRMEQTGPSAADLVNNASEEQLADIFYYYGEETYARKIAKAIVTDRLTTPFSTTLSLASLIHRLVPYRPGGIDTATRSFQALRIAVNHELDELEQGLIAAETLLIPGGRLVVVTFHSLEDRLVKEFFKKRSGMIPKGSRHLPTSLFSESLPPSFQKLNAKPVTASLDEIRRNPRARSAKLRAALKLERLPFTQT